jgi:NADH-quinone oxidoreductase subunit A
MEGSWLLTPPVAVLVMLAAVVLLAKAVSALALKADPAQAVGKAYACGEESPSAMVRPDYGQFVPFAFFFTILHVAALMVTTAPVGTAAAFVIAVLYLVGATVGLTVLYSR